MLNDKSRCAYGVPLRQCSMPSHAPRALTANVQCPRSNDQGRCAYDTHPRDAWACRTAGKPFRIHAPRGLPSAAQGPLPAGRRPPLSFGILHLTLSVRALTAGGRRRPRGARVRFGHPQGAPADARPLGTGPGRWGRQGPDRRTGRVLVPSRGAWGTPRDTGKRTRGGRTDVGRRGEAVVRGGDGRPWWAPSGRWGLAAAAGQRPGRARGMHPGRTRTGRSTAASSHAGCTADAASASQSLSQSPSGFGRRRRSPAASSGVDSPETGCLLRPPCLRRPRSASGRRGGIGTDSTVEPKLLALRRRARYKRLSEPPSGVEGAPVAACVNLRRAFNGGTCESRAATRASLGLEPTRAVRIGAWRRVVKAGLPKSVVQHREQNTLTSF